MSPYPVVVSNHFQPSGARYSFETDPRREERKRQGRERHGPWTVCSMCSMYAVFVRKRCCGPSLAPTRQRLDHAYDYATLPSLACVYLLTAGGSQAGGKEGKKRRKKPPMSRGQSANPGVGCKTGQMERLQHGWTRTLALQVAFWFLGSGLVLRYKQNVLTLYLHKRLLIMDSTSGPPPPCQITICPLHLPGSADTGSCMSFTEGCVCVSRHRRGGSDTPPPKGTGR